MNVTAQEQIICKILTTEPGKMHGTYSCTMFLEQAYNNKAEYSPMLLKYILL